MHNIYCARYTIACLVTILLCVRRNGKSPKSPSYLIYIYIFTDAVYLAIVVVAVVHIVCCSQRSAINKRRSDDETFAEGTKKNDGHRADVTSHGSFSALVCG